MAGGDNGNNGTSSKILAFVIAGMGALIGVYAQNSNDLQQEQIKNLVARIDKLEQQVQTHISAEGHPIWQTNAIKNIEKRIDIHEATAGHTQTLENLATLRASFKEIETQFREAKGMRDIKDSHLEKRIEEVVDWIKRKGIGK